MFNYNFMLMKKLLLLFVATMVLCACEKDDPVIDTGNLENTLSEKQPTDGKVYDATITRLYSVVIRHNLIVPKKAYVMELNGSRYFYMYRSSFGMDLKIGDKINFKVSSQNPSEIVEINGYELSEEGEVAQQGGSVDAGYLFASDPIEATVDCVLLMDVKYLSSKPVRMVFIATKSGNLIYTRSDKLNIDLHSGDRIVYSVYTLFPNSIVELKKLNRN